MRRIWQYSVILGLGLLFWPAAGLAQDPDRPRGVPDYNLTFTTVGAMPRTLNADSADVVISQYQLYDFTFEAGKVYYIPLTFWDRGEYRDRESVLLYGDNVAEPGAILLIAGGVALEIVRGATFTIGSAGAEPVQILGHNQGERVLSISNYQYPGSINAGFPARGSVDATTRVIINNAIMSNTGGVYLHSGSRNTQMEVDIRGLQMLSEVYYVDIGDSILTGRPGGFSASGRAGETPEESATRETTLRLTDCRLEGNLSISSGANVNVYARNSFFMAPVDTTFYSYDSNEIFNISYPVNYSEHYHWLSENFRNPKDAKPSAFRAEFVDCTFSYAWYLDLDEEISAYVAEYGPRDGIEVTEEMIEDVREAFYQSGMIRILETNSRGQLAQVWPPGATASTLVGDFNDDGAVNFQDFVLFAQNFGRKEGSPDFDSRFDLDQSADVGFADFLLFAQAFGQAAGG